MPGVSDPDPGASLSISFSQASPVTTISTSVNKYGDRIFTASPTSQTEVGTHTVSCAVSDGFTSSIITVTITVTNSAPYFGSAFPSTYTAYLN
jgi:hypothetical protein